MKITVHPRKRLRPFRVVLWAASGTYIFGMRGQSAEEIFEQGIWPPEEHEGDTFYRVELTDQSAYVARPVLRGTPHPVP